MARLIVRGAVRRMAQQTARQTARRAAVLAGLLILSTCFQSPVPPIGGTAAEQLGRLEALYADVRELYFQVYVTDGRGAQQNMRGQSLAELRRAHLTLRTRLLESLDALDSNRYGGDDRNAIRTMRRQLLASASIEIPADAPAVDAPAVDAATGGSNGASAGELSTRCRYDASALAASDSALARLTRRIYDCYGAAARRVVTPTDTSDRLTVLARIGHESSREKREALWHSLAPIWQSVNGDGSSSSPYRIMLPLVAASYSRRESPIAEAARSLGLEPAQTESTLVRVLRAWRDHTPTAMVEPWDWFYQNSAVSRIFSQRMSRESLRELNDKFYRDQGADPTTLNIKYDLDPREGKTPVAFTQFGRAARLRSGHYGESEAWVFATYRVGGFDNLVELLHETGHAIHVSAVATRPAFADWPDSDPFTEALGDLLAMEAYEPDWQKRYLGAAASLDESLRGKYAAIAMDVAWALFELRMLRYPGADPNATWTDITREYLHISPHPELSWWAQRGQLVESPGYMMNYAFGAMITAQLRQRVRELRGPFSRPDKGMYDWLSGRLYKWGLERPTREVLRDFLGGPLGPDALVDDIGRLLQR